MDQVDEQSSLLANDGQDLTPQEKEKRKSSIENGPIGQIY